MYAFFASFYSVGFALMPLGYVAARYGGGADGNEKMQNAAVWTAIVVILIPVRIALFAFAYVESCILLCLRPSC